MTTSHQINNMLARIESQAKFKRGGDLAQLQKQLKNLAHDISACLNLIRKLEMNPEFRVLKTQNKDG